jgi:hypothetical protein
MYVPVDQTRATAAANIKARVTLIPTVDASGRLLPFMFILKHSKSSDTHPDQTSMTVVKNLHKKKQDSGLQMVGSSTNGKEN